MKKIFFSLLFFTLSFLWGSSLKETLESIPKEDQEKISSLFYAIFFEDHGAYALFGDKPMSLSGDFLVTPWENTLERMRSGGIFWGWWEKWKHYEHLFPMKNYLLLREPNSINENSNVKSDLIFFINKNLLIETVETHLCIFEKVLNRKIEPKKFLEDIENGSNSLQKSIDNNEMLLGILLGYGKHNASLFIKKNCDIPELCRREDFQEFLTGDAELKPIHKKLDFFGDHKYSPIILGSVHFVADFSHPETKILQEKYNELRGKISKIYAQGDFLEITFLELTRE